MEQQAASAWTPLYTDRLFLRSPEANDHAYAARIHVAPHAGVLYSSCETLTSEAAAARLRLMCEHWERHGFGVWAAAAREAQEKVLGFTGLTYRKINGRTALNVHSTYASESWGRGFARDGLQQAVHHAARFLPNIPVVAYACPSNYEFRRSAMAVGLTRRPELDLNHGNLTEICLALNW